jgi:hypothetical protein
LSHCSGLMLRISAAAVPAIDPSYPVPAPVPVSVPESVTSCTDQPPSPPHHCYHAPRGGQS